MAIVNMDQVAMSQELHQHYLHNPEDCIMWVNKERGEWQERLEAVKREMYDHYREMGFSVFRAECHARRILHPSFAPMEAPEVIRADAYVVVPVVNEVVNRLQDLQIESRSSTPHPQDQIDPEEDEK